MQKTRVFAAVIAALAVTGAPRAQTDRPLLADDREEWPTELTRRPLTLQSGMVELYLPANINASKDNFGESVTLAPSLYFGITDRWMIGVRHQVGICLGGIDDELNTQDCDRRYNDVSVDTVFSLGRAAGLELALGLALNVAPIDPSAWHGEARVIARAGGGALALTVAPTINFGLNDRDSPGVKWVPTTFNLGTYNIIHPEVGLQNSEFLVIPATVHFQVGPTFALAAGASLNGPLNEDDLDFDGGILDRSFGESYTVPVTAAAVVTPIPWIDIGASLTFSNLLGKNDDADFRTLGIFAAFRR